MSSATSTIAPRQTMQGHTGWVNGGVHLPNGRHIMTCSSDSSIRLWDLESGAQIEEDWRDPDENNVGLRSMALSPNGKIIASGSDDGKVRLWDVETTKVISKWTGHTHVVYALCWSADGERVASGSWDRTARVWDVKSGQTVLTIETGHKLVYAVVYSPDGTKIATGGDEEKAVKIWDAKSGELLNTLKHRVCSLAWTSDGKKLISGSYHLVRIFDTATWQQTAILRGHTNFVYAISLFPNNRLLASASDDKTARLWNLDTNLPVGPPLPHEHDLPSVALSHDGKLLLTVCENKDAYIWDIHTILKEAGLEDLLSTESGQHSSRSSLSDKPFLRADATRGLGQFGDDERSPNFFNTSPPMGGAQPRSSLNAILPRISSLLGRFRPNNEVLHHSRPSGFRPPFDRLRSSIHRSTRENDIPDGPQQHSRPSGIHLNALFNRLTSLTHRTPPDNDAPDEPQQPSTSSQLDPHIDEEAQLPQHSRPSVAHLRALLSRLTSLTHRTPPDNDALDEPQQPSTSSRLDPRVLASRLFSHFPRSRLGTDAEEAEADPTTSSPRPGITDRLSSLFRSQPHMDEEIELPERPNHPRVVPATSPLPSSLSAQAATRFNQFETSSPLPPSNGVVQSLRQHLSFLVPRHSHGPPVVEVAPGRKFTRLAAAKLPEYKKVNDTRHPSSQQGVTPQENDTADVDSLPDVHWCKAFLCYYSCLSHGRLRMPPRWRLERVDIPRQDGAASTSRGGAHSRS